MKEVYRVVCSENQRLYPGQTFVDFMPAGMSRQENCLNHESILKMRRLVNPEVDSLENGLIITDYGNGNLELGYEKAYNYQIRRNQDYFKQKYEKLIFERYRQMKEAGKEKTIEVSMRDLAVLYDFHQSVDNGAPKSAREAALIEEAQRLKEAEQRKKDSIEQQAKREQNLTTQQILKWKYSRYSGD